MERSRIVRPYLVIFLERYTLLTSHRDELVQQNFPAARLREISCARPRRMQPMLSDGVEVMKDPLFGPLIAFGLGGIHGEILNHVCFFGLLRSAIATPVTWCEASSDYRLLQGFRGRPPGDIARLKIRCLRVSRWVEELPKSLSWI